VEPSRAVQLLGLVIMGLGVVAAFTRPNRKRLSRLASILGGLLFVGGTLLSSEWRDPQLLHDPYIYAGLIIGVGLPFLFALAWHRASRKRRG
jgi:drug/metabolite transporter (DMT)-like permease